MGRFNYVRKSLIDILNLYQAGYLKVADDDQERTREVIKKAYESLATYRKPLEGRPLNQNERAVLFQMVHNGPKEVQIDDDGNAWFVINPEDYHPEGLSNTEFANILATLACRRLYRKGLVSAEAKNIYFKRARS